MFKDWDKKDLKIGQEVYIVDQGWTSNLDLEVDTYIVSEIKKTVMKCKKGNFVLSFKKGKATCSKYFDSYTMYETKEEAQQSIDNYYNRINNKNYIKNNLAYLSDEQLQKVVDLIKENISK
jgi:hypothetical protein